MIPYNYTSILNTFEIRNYTSTIMRSKLLSLCEDNVMAIPLNVRRIIVTFWNIFVFAAFIAILIKKKVGRKTLVRARDIAIMAPPSSLLWKLSSTRQTLSVRCTECCCTNKRWEVVAGHGAGASDTWQPHPKLVCQLLIPSPRGSSICSWHMKPIVTSVRYDDPGDSVIVCGCTSNIVPTVTRALQCW